MEAGQDEKKPDITMRHLGFRKGKRGEYIRLDGRFTYICTDETTFPCEIWEEVKGDDDGN